MTKQTGDSQESAKQKKLIHGLRIKNAELRMAEARLKRENALIKTENKKLNEKIAVLHDQCSSDCKTILSQIKQLDEHSEVVAQLKAKNAKL